nr:MAG TPA: hypothetical protein [Bacteriophage sp.]
MDQKIQKSYDGFRHFDYIIILKIAGVLKFVH